MRAQVTWGRREGATIPFLSLNRINGQFFAFVSTNEGKGTVARQKLIKIGDNVGNDVEVLDGIKPGDHLITSGTQFLQDGMPVTGNSGISFFDSGDSGDLHLIGRRPRLPPRPAAF